MTAHLIDVVVIGAGQAGLSASYGLQRYGIDHVVLDGNPGPGGAWQHRWPTLRLDTTHHVDDLPGLAMTDRRSDVPAAEIVSDYYAAYEQHFALPVHRPVHVTAVESVGERLRVQTDSGPWDARFVVNATGTWSKPFWPRYPGQEEFRGRQLHTADYRGPQDFAGQHVVVIGGGASAVQHLGEISQVATTTWVTRREPDWREGPFTPEDGRIAVAKVEQAVAEGLPVGSVVGLTGLVVTPWVAEARRRGVLDRLPMFDRIVADGVVWDDGRFVHADALLWATGFRPALDHLAPLRLREPGGGIRMVGTRSAREPRLHLVGYGPSASTVGASRAGRAAAREIKRELVREQAA